MGGGSGRRLHGCIATAVGTAVAQGVDGSSGGRQRSRSRRRSHRHHRQHAGRADAVRRLARDDDARALPEARSGLRNLGFSGDEITTRLRSKNFGTPDEWLSGKAAPIGGYQENRFDGHQHQGRRHLRVLRLQRVVRRRGGARSVQEAARRLDHAHAGAEVQRQIRPAHRPLLADCARRSEATPICPTARRTTNGWRSTRRRWERWPGPQCPLRGSVHAEPAAVRRRQGARSRSTACT